MRYTYDILDENNTIIRSDVVIFGISAEGLEYYWLPRFTGFEIPFYIQELGIVITKAEKDEI